MRRSTLDTIFANPFDRDIGFCGFDEELNEPLSVDELDDLLRPARVARVADDDDGDRDLVALFEMAEA